jgi:hypothetical protein
MRVHVKFEPAFFGEFPMLAFIHKCAVVCVVEEIWSSAISVDKIITLILREQGKMTTTWIG